MSKRVTRPRKPYPGEFLTPWQVEALQARAFLEQGESQMWADGKLTYKTMWLADYQHPIVRDIT